MYLYIFFFSSRRRHTRSKRDWSSDVCSSDLIEHIVSDTEARFSPETFWPVHPKDADHGETDPVYPLYHGASGVVWALHYLEAVGAVSLRSSYDIHVEPLLRLVRGWLSSWGSS